jgi:hypothetical protein
MAEQRITIPFPVLRLLLPADGEIVGFLVGQENKWPQNAHKSRFERDEYLELALGWKLRAQEKHKHTEQAWGPGMKVNADHVRLQFGWRLHVAVPIVGDYFDGAATAMLRLKMVGANLLAEMSNLVLGWNEAIWGNLDKVEHLVASKSGELERQINRRLQGDLPMQVNTLLEQDAYLRKLKHATRIACEGTAIVLTVTTDE